MKWINPGVSSIFDTSSMGTLTNASASLSHTGYAIEFPRGFGSSSILYKNVNNVGECWFSYDIAHMASGWNISDTPDFLFSGKGETTNIVYEVVRNKQNYIEINKCVSNNDSLTVKENLYTSDKTSPITNNGIYNVEIHAKLGNEGRIDVWFDTKLFCSFRSPTAFAEDTNFSKIGINSQGNRAGSIGAWYSSFILQDTRRIGLEKFKKLTIDPDTEQNMPQGSTTTHKLSGLSDATEFSDITSVCAVLQATSRDANITTGTFTLDGKDIGTIDVSDSSGKAYEIAHSETNSATGKSWTVADIEGKTLSFKVNGAE